MKSTTIRFADTLYRQLEGASKVTGLPVNSIVVVACLEWLQKGWLPTVPLRPPGLQPSLQHVALSKAVPIISSALYSKIFQAEFTGLIPEPAHLI